MWETTGKWGKIEEMFLTSPTVEWEAGYGPANKGFFQVNIYVFTFASELWQNNARALRFLMRQVHEPEGWLHWTSIKIEAQMWEQFLMNLNILLSFNITTKIQLPDVFEFLIKNKRFVTQRPIFWIFEVKRKIRQICVENKTLFINFHRNLWEKMFLNLNFITKRPSFMFKIPLLTQGPLSLPFLYHRMSFDSNIGALHPRLFRVNVLCGRPTIVPPESHGQTLSI